MKGTGFGHVDGGEYADGCSLTKWEERLSREMYWCRRKRRTSGRAYEKGDSDVVVSRNDTQQGQTCWQSQTDHVISLPVVPTRFRAFP